MICDLNDIGSGHRSQTCEILVIGGGTVGLIIADHLARSGKRVVVLESGDRKPSPEADLLNEAVQTGMTYAGVLDGRARCLGGTSTKWAGAMLPFEEDDFTIPRDIGWDAEWPIDWGSLTSFAPEVERLFDLPKGSYSGPDFGSDAQASPSFVSRRAKSPPFKMRNVATLLGGRLRQPNGPVVWVNATATAFMTGENGRLASVVARSPGGGTLAVSADAVVLAAGAIESTRILLQIDRQNGGRIFAADDVLGRYFTDHLAVPFAKVLPARLDAFNRLVGFSFEARGMQTLRFEVAAQTRRARRLPGAYAQFTFGSSTPTGFDALKTIYRGLQKHQRPATKDLALLLGDLPWFARAVWWRYVERRLLFPRAPVLRAQLVFEQEPLAANRIRLSADRQDRFGQPLVELDWRIGERDIANAQALGDLFVDYWRHSKGAAAAAIEPFPIEILQAMTGDAEPFYHPTGSARIGRTASEGVVDADLRVFRLPNVSVVSTAVFPSGGSANPTMMLVMAGLKVARRLADQTGTS